MHLREITDYFHFCVISCRLPNISRMISTYKCSSHMADVARRNKDGNRQRGTLEQGEKVREYLVSAALCLDFLIFSPCCCSGRFTNPKCVYLMSWEWDSTINYSIFVVHSGAAGTNLTESTEFNSLWHELQLTFDHKYPPEGDFLLWYSHFRAYILLLLCD